jgi:type III restriction enzyme
VQEKFPQIEDFERQFPSFCFALATGVGKTRLMGAFVAYLHAAHGVRHFLVLAPNLTIYDKLIRDFTKGNEKYVLNGIGTFATQDPVVITGENYESGLGVRRDMLFDTESVHINIFNIAKINSEVRGGRNPRIKRLAEYIGDSYFNYLAGLPDLVLLMDESHRYRAKAGMAAINELAPVLGLELTATPHIEQGGKPVRFRNILLDYPLGNAMRDGFVKEPTVLTREDLRPESFAESPDDLARMKRDDGFTSHEHTKVALELYAKDNGLAVVKPFLLVIAKDTRHADEVKALIDSDAFRAGRYKGKVITVHSNQKREESDETIGKLLHVEDADSPVEVVVHVDKLKEGWDVRNLYTIVPLRAARAVTLVEQSIGRGLRLPYGKRTGVAEVDRLSIAAHDSFDLIVKAANDPQSPLYKQLRVVRVGIDLPTAGTHIIEADPVAVEVITGRFADGRIAQPMFSNGADQVVSLAAMDVLNSYGGRVLPRDRFSNPDVRRDVIRRVIARMPPQATLPGIELAAPVEQVIEQTIDHFASMLIPIPRVYTWPQDRPTEEYDDFDLELGSRTFPPPDKRIVYHVLRTGERSRIDAVDSVPAEPHLENYLLRDLKAVSSLNDILHGTLLMKLAAQAVEHVHLEHADEAVARDVVVHHRRLLVQLIEEQLDAHRRATPPLYQSEIGHDYEPVPKRRMAAIDGHPMRDIHAPVTSGDVRGMVFMGSRKSAYSIERFDSEPERRFASLLERERSVHRWVKLRPGMIRINYSDDVSYVPDFVVQLDGASLLCEVKAADEMKDPTVRLKAAAAVAWCRAATKHALAHGDKPWSYVLIPDDAIRENSSLKALVATCRIDETGD